MLCCLVSVRLLSRRRVVWVEVVLRWLLLLLLFELPLLISRVLVLHVLLFEFIVVVHVLVLHVILFEFIIVVLLLSFLWVFVVVVT